MSADGGRLPVAISVLALLVAVMSAVAGSHDSSADFVVTSTSPGNQVVTLDPQGPASYSVPASRPAGAVELVWTASTTESVRPGLVTYSVHRSPAGAGTYAQLVSGLTTYTYTDTPGSDGSYDYKVRTDISSFSADSVARAGLSDRVPPVITGSAAPAAIWNGWRAGDVTVTFTCTDTGGSGVATCTSPVVLTSEGASQSAGGSSADVAGNTSSATVSGIGIDKSAPTVASSLISSISLSTSLGAVDLAWNAGSDSLSGLAGYTVRYQSVGALVFTCPVSSNAGYADHSVGVGVVTSASPGGLSTGTKYCFYLLTRDNVGWLSAASNVTGPTAAK